ncbi:MAG TPA: TetR family transcriptional regulator [Ferrovibrio sp.]|jgi:AcrR family transcriptional regulator|uniref:TetR family transcriptional regulator n=1 Tax=Ferrovibrio sp. TaxID=1917215 RepID=UPI002ED53C77
MRRKAAPKAVPRATQDEARTPQRERGKQRVAALLDAAAAIFAEKGYEAATMAEIAARAGAAIGSLYQFFPNKELLAGTLRAQYGDALYDDLAALREKAGAWTEEQLAEGLLSGWLDFLERHPGFMALVEAQAGLDAARAADVRARMRQLIAGILQAHAPHLSQQGAASIATAVLQTLKGAAALRIEAELPERTAVLDQLRLMLQLYLKSQLGGKSR